MATDFLIGTDTITYLASLDAQFVLVERLGKRPLGKGWQHAPQTEESALAHLDRGGNVGVLCGRSCLYVIDVDRGLARVLAELPELCDVTRIFRANADDRCKFLLTLDAPMPSASWRGADAEIDFLAAGRQAVVAGQHASGATLRCRPGRVDIPQAGYQLAACLRRAAGAPVKAAVTPATVTPATPAAGAPARWSVIDAYNRATPIRALLAHYGYTIIGNKFTRPGKDPRAGTSGTINDARNSAYTFSPNDPGFVAGDTSPSGAGCTLKPFDLYCRLSFAGDTKAAVRKLMGAMR